MHINKHYIKTTYTVEGDQYLMLQLQDVYCKSRVQTLFILQRARNNLLLNRLYQTFKYD